MRDKPKKRKSVLLQVSVYISIHIKKYILLEKDMLQIQVTELTEEKLQAEKQKKSITG